MKIPRHQRVQAVIPLCSMSDIAFLLLIFFIVLAKGVAESTVDWKPATTTIKINPADNSLCTVTIDKNSEVFVNGQPVGMSALKQAVTAYLGDRPRGQRKVLLKIDHRVPAQIFEQVMLDIGDVGGDIFRVLDPASNK